MKKFLFLAIAIAGSVAYACGPSFPNTYLMFGGEAKVLKLSRADDTQSRLAKIEAKQLAKKVVEEARRGWKNTRSTEQQELSKALFNGSPTPEQQQFLREYDAMRIKIKQYFDPHTTTGNFYRKPFAPRWNHQPQPEVENKRFDLEPYAELLQKLPEEFRLYTLGAEAYRAHAFDDAAKHWESLLALPKEQRTYRTVWTSFMLGKLEIHRNPKAAAKHFENTRAFAEAGFSDPLSLSSDSIGWQALGERDAGNYSEAITLYKQQIEGDNPAYALTASQSINSVTHRLMRERPIRQALLDDPLLENIIRNAVNNGGDRELEGESWAALLPESPTSVKSPDDLLKSAKRAYYNGKLEEADQWLSQYEGDSPYADWMRAKLFLWKGEQGKAMVLMEKLTANTFEEDAEGHSLFPEIHIAYAEAGVLNLSQGNYTDALDHFVKRGYGYDAAYVAFAVMSIDELEAYVTSERNEQPQEEKVETWDQKFYRYMLDAPHLHKLLAIRYARAGQWEKALPFYSDSDREIAKHYLKLLKDGEDTQLKKSDRIKAYRAAADLMYQEGAALNGIDASKRVQVLSRDRFSIGMTLASRQRKSEAQRARDGYTFPTSILASEDELARAQKHFAETVGNDHSRTLVANHLWECAKLLPDNDPRTAYALYEGGAILKAQDPQRADRFYKALVNRCRKLPIGQEADTLRWFPNTPPPLPDGWEPIKGYY